MLVSVFFIITISCGLYFCIIKNRARDLKTIIYGTDFFVPIPIEKYSDSHIPCICLKIEDKIFSVSIDLGFRGYLCLFKNAIDQISEKILVGTDEKYGFRGNKHSHPVYLIPQIEIGNATFSKIPILEETEEIRKEAVITENEEQILFFEEQGKLGWEIFTLFNLLLDYKNATIAFCNSDEMLKKQGYPISEWAKAPLFLEDGFVEFTAETENGPLRCILDSGCTVNILNMQVEGKECDLLLDPKYQIQRQSLKVGDSEFGPVIFRPMPVNLPVHVEAFLGMEFIKEHTIFIDFQNKMVYISPKNRFDVWIGMCHKFLTSLAQKF